MSRKKTKAISKTSDSQKPTPLNSNEEFKKVLKEYYDPQNESLTELREFGKSGKHNIKKHNIELLEKFNKAATAIGWETHQPLSETVYKEYRPLAVGFANQLEKDYGCSTAGEKALVELIASSYIRILQISQKMTAALSDGFLSKEKNDLYGVLSKELDRANRHFTNALLTLKQLKSPSIDVNVKSKTAFVSQNQQFNAFTNPNNQSQNNDRQ